MTTNLAGFHRPGLAIIPPLQATPEAHIRAIISRSGMSNGQAFALLARLAAEFNRAEQAQTHERKAT